MKLFAIKSAQGRRRLSFGFTLAGDANCLDYFSWSHHCRRHAQRPELYGLRVYNLATMKVKAATSGREAINTIHDLVRSAQNVYVGLLHQQRIFNQWPPESKIRPGTRSRFFPTTNTATTRRDCFFQGPGEHQLSEHGQQRGGFGGGVNLITNYSCFQAEDYQGNILTNAGQNNPVIDVTLMFQPTGGTPIGYSGGGGRRRQRLRLLPPAHPHHHAHQKITRCLCE